MQKSKCSNNKPYGSNCITLQTASHLLVKPASTLICWCEWHLSANVRVACLPMWVSHVFCRCEWLLSADVRGSCLPMWGALVCRCEWPTSADGSETLWPHEMTVTQTFVTQSFVNKILPWKWKETNTLGYKSKQIKVPSLSVLPEKFRLFPTQHDHSSRPP